MSISNTDSIATRADLVSIKIPDPLECLPPRARRVGGRNHQVPYWSATTTFAIPAGPDLTSWNLTAIQSNIVSPGVASRKQKMKTSFSFLSLKNGRTQTGESPHELQNAREKEVDPVYIDYQLQGIRLHWDANGEPARYTADTVTLAANGNVVAEEVKASSSYFAVPDYAARMRLVEQDLATFDIRFRRVTGDAMAASRRRHYNVTRAFTERFTSFGAREIDAVGDLFAAHGKQVPMGIIFEALAPDLRIAHPIMNAMMCARHLAYNLDHMVTRDTIVTPAPQAVRDLRDIRAL